MKKEKLKSLIKETIKEVKKEEFIEFTKHTINEMKKDLLILKKMMKEDGYDIN
jgi:hypothetical protein